MNRQWIGLLLLVCQLPAQAAVSAARAERLNGELTPLGALRAGNADRSIPAWDGGLTPERRPEGYVAGARYLDPYADEAPLFEITAGTLASVEARLSPGQQALFATLPDSFRMPVYATHRSAAAPSAFYAGSLHNAMQARLGADGLPQQTVAGIPFPIVGNEAEAGLEAIWNHRLRWRGPGRDRAYLQAAVSTTGIVSLTRLRERARFNALDAPEFGDAGRVLSLSFLGVLEPARLAGSLKVMFDTVKPPYRAWQRSVGPDLLWLKKTTEAFDDTGVIGAEGLLSEDQREGFTGRPDRYQWKLSGTRELYVPYNAYRLHRAGLGVADLLGPRHLNPEHLRYELHRVRVLDARLKPGAAGVWPRRTFYLDEDSWQILLVELYDRDEHLVRVQEVHTLMAYDQPLLMPVLDLVYDLPGRRYLASGIDNAEPESVFVNDDPKEFDSGKAPRWARKVGAVPPK